MSIAVIKTEKKYCSKALVTAIIFGFPFILGDYAPIGKGLILGTLFSILNFILIGETLFLKIGGYSRKRLFTISLGLLLVRFGLLAIPVVIAIKFEQFQSGHCHGRPLYGPAGDYHGTCIEIHFFSSHKTNINIKGKLRTWES